MNVFSSTRSVPGVSEPRRARGLHGFARLILVLAWTAFWFNTALFPCREAVAGAFGEHSDDVSQSSPAAQSAHYSDDTHSGCPHNGSDSPCDYILNAGPAIDGTDARLPTDRVQPEWFAIDVSVAGGLTEAIHSASLAAREYRPQPPFFLHLHTQRLLI